MSATPSDISAGWQKPEGAKPGPKPVDDGRNALQALLTFACIHQQAERRRSQDPIRNSSRVQQEQFALDEVLQLIAERAIAITGADGIAIALAHDNAIVCRASSGEIAPDAGVKLDPNAGFSGVCLRSGQTIRCDDSETDSRVNAEACRMLGTRSMIAVPLSAKQRVIGLIEAFCTEPYGFNDSDVKSLNLLGELILAAIRPEDEDRLAELSQKIVVPEPLPFTHSAPPLVQPRSARIIVDEKFPPLLTAGPAALPAEESKAEITSEPATENDRTAQVIQSELAIPELAVPEVDNEPLLALPTPKRSWLRRSELEAPGELPRTQRSVVGIALVIGLVMVAIGLGWAIWEKIVHHPEQALSANTQPSIEVKTSDTETHEVIPPAEPVPKPGPTPQVTGLRHWSSTDSSTVVVDLEDQVQYEAHTLENPARIYFDLHDTKIAAGLLNQSIEVNDTFLKRIRMAQPSEGITRVVLETKNQAEFAVSLDTNPYRLTIEVRRPRTSTAPKPAPSNLTKPSPALLPSLEKGKASALPSAELRIVLDAGHGGWDLGTVGKKGLLEKDLVLDIVQRLGKLVETRLNAQVIYTRQDDSYLPLEKRAEIANLAKASLFLSIHANYSDLTTARGVETYYTNTYSSVKARTDGDDPQLQQVDWTGVDIRAKVTDSHRLAADIQNSLYSGLASRNPDIRNRGVKEAQYVVLTGTQMPAVLAEVSFVSSPADEDKLQNSDYRQQIAEALYKGIAKYHDEGRHPKLASAGRKPQS